MTTPRTAIRTVEMSGPRFEPVPAPRLRTSLRQRGGAAVSMRARGLRTSRDSSGRPGRPIVRNGTSDAASGDLVSGDLAAGDWAEAGGTAEVLAAGVSAAAVAGGSGGAGLASAGLGCAGGVVRAPGPRRSAPAGLAGSPPTAPA